MSYFYWYLISVLPCSWFAHAAGAKFNGRFVRYESNGYWRPIINFFYQGLKILINDLFRLHCPWSWETAKKYRIAELQEDLGLDGLDHDKLGHMSAIDCSLTSNHEKIARECFVSRKTFWIMKLTALPFAPIAAVIYLLKLLNRDLFRYTERDPI